MTFKCRDGREKDGLYLARAGVPPKKAIPIGHDSNISLGTAGMGLYEGHQKGEQALLPSLICFYKH